MLLPGLSYSQFLKYNLKSYSELVSKISVGKPADCQSKGRLDFHDKKIVVLNHLLNVCMLLNCSICGVNYLSILFLNGLSFVFYFDFNKYMEVTDVILWNMNV